MKVSLLATFATFGALLAGAAADGHKHNMSMEHNDKKQRKKARKERKKERKGSKASKAHKKDRDGDDAKEYFEFMLDNQGCGDKSCGDPCYELHEETEELYTELEYGYMRRRLSGHSSSSISELVGDEPFHWSVGMCNSENACVAADPSEMNSYESLIETYQAAVDTCDKDIPAVSFGVTQSGLAMLCSQEESYLPRKQALIRGLLLGLEPKTRINYVTYLTQLDEGATTHEKLFAAYSVIHSPKFIMKSDIYLMLGSNANLASLFTFQDMW